MPLTEQNLQLLPTIAALTQLLRGNTARQKLVETGNKLAQDQHFSHWCLEFPQVFETDSFDCVLGNPQITFTFTRSSQQAIFISNF